jgi:hypothetical protein
MFQGSESKRKEWAPEFCAHRFPKETLRLRYWGVSYRFGAELGGPYSFVKKRSQKRQLSESSV